MAWRALDRKSPACANLSTKTALEAHSACNGFQRMLLLCKLARSIQRNRSGFRSGRCVSLYTYGRTQHSSICTCQLAPHCLPISWSLCSALSQASSALAGPSRALGRLPHDHTGAAALAAAADMRMSTGAGAGGGGRANASSPAPSRLLPAAAASGATAGPAGRPVPTSLPTAAASGTSFPGATAATAVAAGSSWCVPRLLRPLVLICDLDDTLVGGELDMSGGEGGRGVGWGATVGVSSACTFL